MTHYVRTIAEGLLHRLEQILVFPADRVDAQVLMELMRHEDIETTLRFYVGRNARRTSRALWRAYNREMEERGADARRGKGEPPEQAKGFWRRFFGFGGDDDEE